MDCCSDEVDSTSNRDLKRRSSGSATATADDQTGTRDDGASIEIAKRRRGRPPGSKNKPKPHRAAIAAASGVPTPTPSPSSFPSSSGGVRTHILEIPGGRDVAAALAAFSRRRGLGVSVLGGSGAVADVTLRQPPHPSSWSSSTVTLRGQFEVLSLSAIFLPPTLSAAIAVGGASELKVCVSGQEGRVLGGAVMGPLMTAGTLVVVVAAFSAPTIHRLPEQEQDGADGGTTAEAESRGDEDDKEGNVEDDGGHALEHQYEYDNYFYNNHTNGGAPGGASIYGGGHLYSDMLWHMSPPY